LKYHFINP